MSGMDYMQELRDELASLHRKLDEVQARIAQLQLDATVDLKIPDMANSSPDSLRSFHAKGA